ncbi:hypothetical protein COBT_002049 [Conglomerata obtusa]
MAISIVLSYNINKCYDITTLQDIDDDPHYQIEKHFFDENCANRLTSKEIFDLKNETIIKTKLDANKMKNLYKTTTKNKFRKKRFYKCIFPINLIIKQIKYCHNKRMINQPLSMLKTRLILMCKKCNYLHEYVFEDCIITDI